MKIAWIDYQHKLYKLFREELESEFDLDVEKTLDKFQEKHDPKEYNLILYHPGMANQKQLESLLQENSNAVLITEGAVDYEAYLPHITYNIDEIKQAYENIQIRGVIKELQTEIQGPFHDAYSVLISFVYHCELEYEKLTPKAQTNLPHALKGIKKFQTAYNNIDQIIKDGTKTKEKIKNIYYEICDPLRNGANSCFQFLTWCNEHKKEIPFEIHEIGDIMNASQISNQHITDIFSKLPKNIQKECHNYCFNQ